MKMKSKSSKSTTSKKSKLLKHSSKETKKTKTSIKNLTSIQKLYDEFNELNTQLERLILDNNSTNKEQNRVMDKIEDIQIKINKTQSSFYPSIYNEKLAQQLFQQKDFNLFKIKSKETDIKNLLDEYKKPTTLRKSSSKSNNKDKDKKTQKQKKSFEVTNTQILLKNFMGPQSPYRGMLIFHGTGVGKTCTGITIAENLKHIVKNNKQKIYVIRYEDIKGQIFESNKLKTNQVKKQCTKDTYIKELIKKDKSNKELLDKCKSNPMYCDSVMLKLNKLIKTYYDFKNVEKWARDTSALINKTKKNLSKQEQHLNKISEIRKEFSNSVIIIDEAHHITSTVGSLDLKLISSVLTDVLKYSHNIRLIMLTATPLWDKPTDIISLLNYMLINDKRTPLQVNNIFLSDGKFKKTGEKILKQKLNGYISYMRGDDPFKFPLRLSAKYNVPNQIIKKYPINYISNDNIYSFQNKKFEVFDIIDAPMSKEQLEVYNKLIKLKETHEEYSTVWTSETQISNFIYQTLDDANNNLNNCYGENGFKAITNSKVSGSYSFKDEKYGKHFLMENLHIYSKKIAMIMKNIEKSDGPVFIFSNLIWGGISPLIIALEMNGYKKYKSHNEPFINNKYKSGDYKGDYIVRSGTIKSTNIGPYIAKRENMINENVKVFIGSETAAEGLSLFGYREVHVLEPHFNFSLIEQVIGRCIRNESHLSLPVQKRNVSIYLYASTTGKNESVDLFKYRISESKAILIGDVERILKEKAIDCYLNYYGNNIYGEQYRDTKIKLITSHNQSIDYNLNDSPYSRICNYSKKCHYYCNDDKKETLSILNKDVIDQNFVNINNIENRIYKLKIKIIGVVLEYRYIKITDIKKIIKLKKKYNQIFDIILISIIKDNKTYNNKGEYGKIIVYNNYLKFINVNNLNPNIEFVEQYLNKNKKDFISEIDLRFYINKMKEHNLELEKTNILKYKSLITNFQFEFEKIKYKLPNNKYRFSLKPSDDEIINILFYKLTYDIKLKIIKTIITNKINNNKLSKIELLLDELMKSTYLITKKEMKNSINLKGKSVKSSRSKKESQNKIYGFFICNYKSILVYKYDAEKKDFVIDNAYNNKIINYRLKKFKAKKINNLFAYITIDNKNAAPTFKIMDLRDTTKKSQKGSRCIDKQKGQIIKYYETISNNKIETKKKEILCNDLELLFRRKDLKDPSKLWLLNNLEYELYLMLN